MSKSKNNGVDPQALIDRYGADTVRLYTMFTSPPDQALEWSDEGVEGASRFLRRLWSLAVERADVLQGGGGDIEALGKAAQQARREIHAALNKALYDYERHQFNTVVSACMTMVNQLHKVDDSPGGRAVLREGMSIVLRLLAPIAPHVTHYLWRELGYGEDILSGGWPAPDAEALRRDRLELVVQVNGKLRGKVEVPADADQQTCREAALANDNVARFIGDRPLRKVIVVPGKLINLVV
jgi:leucyl-tRNA synthetase